jgi:hypothetical protein
MVKVIKSILICYETNLKRYISRTVPYAKQLTRYGSSIVSVGRNEQAVNVRK